MNNNHTPSKADIQVKSNDILAVMFANDETADHQLWTANDLRRALKKQFGAALRTYHINKVLYRMMEGGLVVRDDDDDGNPAATPYKWGLGPKAEAPKKELPTHAILGVLFTDKTNEGFTVDEIQDKLRPWRSTGDLNNTLFKMWEDKLVERVRVNNTILKWKPGPKTVPPSLPESTPETSSSSTA